MRESIMRNLYHWLISFFVNLKTSEEIIPCHLLGVHHILGASLVAQMVKNLPAMQETWFQSLGWEDLGGGHGNPLQYFCLENPQGQRSLVGCSPWGLKESDMTEATEHKFYLKTTFEVHKK